MPEIDVKDHYAVLKCTKETLGGLRPYQVQWNKDISSIVTKLESLLRFSASWVRWSSRVPLFSLDWILCETFVPCPIADGQPHSNQFPGWQVL